MSEYDDSVRRQLMFEEGSRRIVFGPVLPGFPLPPHGSYLDTENVWTTGYGFNLEDGAATTKALAAVTLKTAKN